MKRVPWVDRYLLVRTQSRPPRRPIRFTGFTFNKFVLSNKNFPFFLDVYDHSGEHLVLLRKHGDAVEVVYGQVFSRIWHNQRFTCRLNDHF